MNAGRFMVNQKIGTLPEKIHHILVARESANIACKTA